MSLFSGFELSVLLLDFVVKYWPGKRNDFWYTDDSCLILPGCCGNNFLLDKSEIPRN